MKPDDKEIKITKLEIQLIDDKISISTADAKKLYDALAELFASKRCGHICYDYRPYSYLGSGLAQQAIGSAALGQPQNCSLSVQESTLQMAIGA